MTRPFTSSYPSSVRQVNDHLWSPPFCVFLSPDLCPLCIIIEFAYFVLQLVQNVSYEPDSVSTLMKTEHNNLHTEVHQVSSRPSIIYSIWSQSRQTSGEMWGIPWAGCQSVSGLSQGDEYPPGFIYKIQRNKHLLLACSWLSWVYLGKNTNSMQRRCLSSIIH